MKNVTGIPALFWPSATVTCALSVTCWPSLPWVDFSTKSTLVGTTALTPLNLPISSPPRDTLYSLSAVWGAVVKTTTFLSVNFTAAFLTSRSLISKLRACTLSTSLSNVTSTVVLLIA